MPTIGVRVDDSVAQWLDDMRGPGETRSHVVRRVLDMAIEAQAKAPTEKVERPVLAPITWKFPPK